MKTSSCKQKGRRLVQKLKERLLHWCPDLVEDDLIVTSSGANGEDLKLSPAAQKVYPLVFECKNQEKLNVHAAFSQAQSHVKDDRKPVLVFSKNHTEPMVAIKLEDFLWLIR